MSLRSCKKFSDVDFWAFINVFYNDGELKYFLNCTKMNLKNPNVSFWLLMKLKCWPPVSMGYTSVIQSRKDHKNLGKGRHLIHHWQLYAKQYYPDEKCERYQLDIRNGESGQDLFYFCFLRVCAAVSWAVHYRSWVPHELHQGDYTPSSRGKLL